MPNEYGVYCKDECENIYPADPNDKLMFYQKGFQIKLAHTPKGWIYEIDWQLHNRGQGSPLTGKQPPWFTSRDLALDAVDAELKDLIVWQRKDYHYNDADEKIFKTTLDYINNRLQFELF